MKKLVFLVVLGFLVAPLSAQTATEYMKNSVFEAIKAKFGKSKRQVDLSLGLEGNQLLVTPATR